MPKGAVVVYRCNDAGSFKTKTIVPLSCLACHSGALQRDAVVIRGAACLDLAEVCVCAHTPFMSRIAAKFM